jgi:hypothetical protein
MSTDAFSRLGSRQETSRHGNKEGVRMLSYSVNVSLVRRETPRLCRGGSKSLTAPAVCFSIQVPGPLALRLGVCDFDFGSRQGPFEGPATRKASGSAGGYLHV